MRQNGFTLIELLMAVGIMLILSGVGLTSFTFSIKKSHDAGRKSDLATIQRGLEAFAADWSDYPADDEGGKMKACDYNNSGVLSICAWGSPMAAYFKGSLVTYLVKLPADSTSAQAYYYQKTATGYDLFAALENTLDPYFKSGLTQSCGSGVTCNYQVSQAGVQ